MQTLFVFGYKEYAEYDDDVDHDLFVADIKLQFIFAKKNNPNPPYFY